MTRPLIVDGRAITCRLAIVEPDGESFDLGRIAHEVTAVELVESLPQLDTDDDAYLVVELWEETEWTRRLLDEREVDRALGNVLVDGRLEERMREHLGRIFGPTG